MYSSPQLALKYIAYYLTANNAKGHGTHSPFVYSFIHDVLNDNRTFYAFHEIELIRHQLLHNQQKIDIEDFGAGSRKGLNNTRTISSIAHSSLKPKKYARLLFKMINAYQSKTIIELGTSLGITTAYLAAANPTATVVTMEGAKSVAAIAKQNFEQLQLHNIQLIEGNFEKTLSNTLTNLTSIDFAFIDGNHQYKPTVDYFNQLINAANQYTIIIADDIHWSKEMEDAWKFIQQHSAVTLTIDLFFIGVVFLRTDFLVKQHFVIRY